MLLLDTGICVSLIHGKPPQVRQRFEQAIAGGVALYVSSVSAVELWSGIGGSALPARNKARVETFLTGPFGILDFDADDAAVAGQLRTEAEKQDMPLTAYDLLIVAQAVRRGMTMVTDRLWQFEWIVGLSLEDWTRQVKVDQKAEPTGSRRESAAGRT